MPRITDRTQLRLKFIVMTALLHACCTASPVQVRATDIIRPPPEAEAVTFGTSVATAGGWLAVSGSEQVHATEGLKREKVYIYARKKATTGGLVDSYWRMKPVGFLATGNTNFGAAIALQESPGCTSGSAECPFTIVVGTGHPSNKAFIFECVAFDPAMAQKTPLTNVNGIRGGTAATGVGPAPAAQEGPKVCPAVTALDYNDQDTNFGAAVAIQGGVVAVGSGNGKNTVWLFKRQPDGMWPGTASATTSIEAGHTFGSTLAFTGDALFVGSAYDSLKAPAQRLDQVWMYRAANGTVQLNAPQAWLPPESMAAVANYGASVSASQDMLVVANPNKFACSLLVYLVMPGTEEATHPVPLVTLDVDGSHASGVESSPCDPMGVAVAASPQNIALIQPVQGNTRVLVWSQSYDEDLTEYGGWPSKASYELVVAQANLGGEHSIAAEGHTVALGTPGLKSVQMYTLFAPVQGSIVPDSMKGAVADAVMSSIYAQDGTCTTLQQVLLYCLICQLAVSTIVAKHLLPKIQAPDPNPSVGTAKRFLCWVAYKIGLSFNGTSPLSCLRALCTELLDATVLYLIWVDLTWVENHGLVWATVLVLVLIKLLCAFALAMYYCFMILPTPIPRSLIAAHEDGTAISELNDQMLSAESARYIEQISTFSDIVLMLDCICDMPLCVVNFLGMCVLVQAGWWHAIGGTFTFAMLSGTVYEMLLGYFQEKRTEVELARRNIQVQIEQDSAVQVVQMAELGMEPGDLPAPNSQEQAMSLL